MSSQQMQLTISGFENRIKILEDLMNGFDSDLYIRLKRECDFKLPKEYDVSIHALTILMKRHLSNMEPIDCYQDLDTGTLQTMLIFCCTLRMIEHYEKSLSNINFFSLSNDLKRLEEYNTSCSVLLSLYQRQLKKISTTIESYYLADTLRHNQNILNLCERIYNIQKLLNKREKASVLRH